MNFMLDTQIYDRIVETEGMSKRLNQLSRDGQLTLLTTHIQEDELAQIADAQKKTAIGRIERTLVPTSGAIADVSRSDLATYGNGAIGGVTIGDIRSNSGRHARDALIATTAARDADALVTEDRRLANRMRALGPKCAIWDFIQFVRFVYE